MTPQFDYDIAISFAEEDSMIASALATILEDNKLKVYHYKHENHVMLGKNLPVILPEIYARQAEFAIALISKDYMRKRYTLIEFEAIMSRLANDKNYLIPIKVGDVNVTDLQGMNEVVFYKFDGDFREVAHTVIRRCHLLRSGRQQPDPQNIAAPSSSQKNSLTIIEHGEKFVVNSGNGNVTHIN